MENWENNWIEIQAKVSDHFKVEADFNFMLFMIGIQDIGSGLTSYTRDEKMDIINLGKCRLLTNCGYLRQISTTKGDWPAFEEVIPLGEINPLKMENILKAEMVSYFTRQFS